MSDYLPGFTPPNSTCILYAPFGWHEFAAGESKTYNVDLSGCVSPDVPATFEWYGHLTSGNKTGAIRYGDGITLSARNVDTGQVFMQPVGQTGHEIRLKIPVSLPGHIECFVTNDAHKTQKIRPTWISDSFV